MAKKRNALTYEEFQKKYGKKEKEEDKDKKKNNYGYQAGKPVEKPDISKAWKKPETQAKNEKAAAGSGKKGSSKLDAARTVGTQKRETQKAQPEKPSGSYSLQGKTEPARQQEKLNYARSIARRERETSGTQPATPVYRQPEARPAAQEMGMRQAERQNFAGRVAAHGLQDPMLQKWDKYVEQATGMQPRTAATSPYRNPMDRSPLTQAQQIAMKVGRAEEEAGLKKWDNFVTGQVNPQGRTQAAMPDLQQTRGKLASNHFKTAGRVPMPEDFKKEPEQRVPRVSKEQLRLNYIDWYNKQGDTSYSGLKRYQGINRPGINLATGESGLPTIEEFKGFQQRASKYGGYDRTDQPLYWSDEMLESGKTHFTQQAEEQNRAAEEARAKFERSQPSAAWDNLIDFLQQTDLDNENSILSGAGYSANEKANAQQTLNRLQANWDLRRDSLRQYAMQFFDDENGYRLLDMDDQQEKREALYNALMPDTYAERTEKMNAKQIAQLDMMIDEAIERADMAYSVSDYHQELGNALVREKAYRDKAEEIKNAQKGRTILKDFSGWANQFGGSAEYKPELIPEAVWSTDTEMNSTVQPQGTDIQKSYYWANNRNAMGGMENSPKYTQPEYFMDDNELAVFNQLFDRTDTKLAESYLKGLMPFLKQRQRDYINMYNEATSEMPVVGEAARIMSPWMNAVGGLTGTVGAVMNLLGVKSAKDDSSAWYAMTNFVRTLRSHQNDIVSDWFGKKFGGDAQSIANFVLNVVDSVSDNIAAMSTASAISGGELTEKSYKAIQLIMSGEATSNTMLEKLADGTDATEAAVYAIGDGIIEWITEKYSLEVILSPDIRGMTGNWKALARYLFDASVAEGSEEIAADLLNSVFDHFMSAINGHETELTRKYEALMANDMEPQEAARQVLSEYLGKLGMSFAAGALSGLALAGGRTATTKSEMRLEGARIRSQGGLESLIETGLDAPKTSQGYKMARNIQMKMENGQKISNTEISGLKHTLQLDAMDIVDKAAESRNLAEIKLPKVRRSIATLEAAETVGLTKEQLKAAGLKLATQDEIRSAEGERVNGPAGVLYNSEEGRKLGKLIAVKGSGSDTQYVIEIDGRDITVDASEVQSTDHAGAILLRERQNRPGVFSPEFTNLVLQEMQKQKEDNPHVLSEAAKAIRFAAMTGAAMPKTGINAETADILYNASKQEQEAARKKLARNALGAGKGVVTFKGIEYGTDDFEQKISGLDEETKSWMKATAAMATILGQKVRFVDTDDVRAEQEEKKEKYQDDPRGMYGKESAQEIVLNIDGKQLVNGEFTDKKHHMMAAYAHEMTHWLQRNTETGYTNLAQFIMDMQREKLGQGGLTERLEEVMDRRGISLAEAVDEMVADSCDQILTNKEVVEHIREKNPGLYGKIKEFVQDLVKRVQTALGGIGMSISRDARTIIGQQTKELARLYNVAIDEAVLGTAAEDAADTAARMSIADATDRTILQGQADNHIKMNAQARDAIYQKYGIKENDILFGIEFKDDGTVDYAAHDDAEKKLIRKISKADLKELYNLQKDTEKWRDTWDESKQLETADYWENAEQIDRAKKMGMAGMFKETQPQEKWAARIKKYGKYVSLDQDAYKDKDKEYEDAVKAKDWGKAEQMLMEKYQQMEKDGLIGYNAVHFHNGDHAEIARMIKSGDPTIIKQAAEEMALKVPDDAVLVPMPPHTGEVTDETDTMILAKAIGEITGSPIATVLESNEHISRNAAKKQGIRGVNAESMGFRVSGNYRFGKFIKGQWAFVDGFSTVPDSRMPIFIDNVVGGAVTAQAAHDALGRGITLAYAQSSRSKIKGAKYLSVTYDSEGKLIPLSQRMDPNNPSWKYSIAELSDGTKYLNLDTEQEIFDKATIDQYPRIVEQYITNKYKGKVIGEINRAYVDRRSAKEYAHPVKRNMDADAYNAKARAATELDNLMNVAKFKQHVEDDGRHPEAIGGWDQYTAIISVPGTGRFFEGTINIEKVAKGDRFHDMTQIKDVTSEMQGRNASLNTGNILSNNISQKQSEDKAKYSKAEMDSQYDQAVKSGDKTTQQKIVDAAAEQAMKNSKIRGEDGKLLAVYHGTEENFTVFDRTKGRANMDIQGMFFSPWEEDAAGYGQNVGKYYLNITNPAPEQVAYKVLRMFQGQNNAGVKARDYLIKQGYDGVSYEGYEYIAFDPEQIKSADPVTKDDNGNVIPISQRFNQKNNDVRYSQAEMDPKQKQLHNAWYEARDRQEEARQQLDDIRPEVNAWTKKIRKAMQDGTQDEIMPEYKEWEKKYIKIRDAVTEAEKAYKKANQEYEDYIEERDVAAEKKAIEKSGLSEPDYRRQQALKTFKTTTDFREAGYLLPDGKLLDFSGAHGQHIGMRGEDHRGIGQIYASSKMQGGRAMVDFMKGGNIRVMAETPGVDIISTAEPTSSQYDAIRNMARRFAREEYFNVDFTDENGDNVDSIEYEGRVDPTRIVNDIKNFFQTGEARQPSVVSQFHYSTAEESMDVEAWMAARTPGSFRTEVERTAWEGWMRLRNTLRTVDFTIDQYTKKLKSLEAKDKATLTQEERQQMVILKNRIKLQTEKRARLEKEMRATTSSEGFATMMKNANETIAENIAGKTAAQVTAAVDTMSEQVKQADKEIARQEKALEEMAETAAVKTAKKTLEKHGLTKMTKALKTSYNTSMSDEELKARMAEITLKKARGEDVTEDVQALASDMASRQVSRAAQDAKDALDVVRRRTYVIGPEMQKEMKAMDWTLNDIKQATKGSGVKFRFGQTSTLDTDIQELEQELPAMREKMDNDKGALENLVNYIKGLVELKNGEGGSGYEGLDVDELETTIDAITSIMISEEAGGMSGTALLEKIREEQGRIGAALDAVKGVRQSMKGALESGKRAQTWATAMKADMDTALEYYAGVAKTAAQLERRQVRQSLIDQLKSEHTKALIEQQAKYEERIKNDKKARETVEDTKTLQSKITTVAKQMKTRLLTETDKKNIPEEAKPIVRMVMRTLLESEKNSKWRRVLNADKKALLDADTRLQKMEATAEPFDEDRDLDWLVIKAQNPADNDYTIRDKVKQDLVDIETGLLEFRNAEGLGLTSLKDRKAALEKVQNAMSEIWGVIRARGEAFIEGKKWQVFELAEVMEKEMAGSKFKGERRGRGSAAIDSAVKFVGYGNLTPEYFIKNLHSKVMTMLHKGLQDGENRSGLEAAKAKAAIAKIAQETGFRKWDGQQTHDITLASGRKIQMTTEQIMSLYATWKREQNMIRPEDTTHLLNGGMVLAQNNQREGKYRREQQDLSPIRLKESDLSRIGDLLTKGQKEYVDRIVEYMSKDMAEIGNEASMQMYGIKKYTEDYYFPIKSWDGVLNKNSASGTSNMNDNRAARQSFTKRLTANARNAIEIGDFTPTAMKHITGMITFTTISPAVENMNKVLNQQLEHGTRTEEEDNTYKKNMRASFQQHYGKNAHDYLVQFMDDVNGGVGRRTGTSFKEKLLSVFRKSAVSGSLSVALQQPLSYIRAANMISPTYLAEAVLPTNWTRIRQEMMEHSGIAVIKDMGRFDMNQGKSMQDYITPEGYKSKAKATMEKISDATTVLPQKMDALTWGRMWVACKLETKAQNPGMDTKSDEFLEKVGERFNDIMRKTQVYDSVMVKSQNMRSTNYAVKSLTSFMAEPTLSLNVLADAVQNVKEKGGKLHLANAATTYALSAVMQALFKSIMSTGRTPDKKKTWVEQFLTKWANMTISELNPASAIPGYSEFIELLKNGELSDDAMSVIGKLKTVGKTAIEWAGGKSDSDYRAFEDTIGQLAQLFTNVPVKNLMRDARAMYNFFAPGTYANRKNSAGVIKYGILEGLHTADNLTGVLNTYLNMAGAGYDTSIEGNIDRIYAATKSGNEKKAREMSEYVVLGKSKANDPEAQLQSEQRKRAKADDDLSATERYDAMVQYGLKEGSKFIYDEYEKGNLTREEAEDLYKRDNPKASTKDMYEALDKIDWKKAGHSGDNYSNYTPLYEGMDNNKSAEIGKAVGHMLEIGYEPKDIKRTINGTYKKKYLEADSAGRIKIRNALEIAYKELGYTKEDADKTINSWKDE